MIFLDVCLNTTCPLFLELFLPSLVHILLFHLLAYGLVIMNTTHWLLLNLLPFLLQCTSLPLYPHTVLLLWTLLTDCFWSSFFSSSSALLSLSICQWLCYHEQYSPTVFEALSFPPLVHFSPFLSAYGFVTINTTHQLFLKLFLFLLYCTSFSFYLPTALLL